jgi:UDP:flavonoid glycosyltransferase YjiC (YdhE family)
MRVTFHPLLTPAYFASFGECVADGFDAAVETERPDFVLIDPQLWGAMVGGEASKVLWATVAHNPLFFRAMGVDPRGPGLPPPTTWHGRLRHSVLERVIRLETRVHLQELNRVRARRSLRPLARVTDLYTSPPLILATTTQSFEYPRSDWPSGLEFIGPMICDPAEGDTSLPDPSDPRPLILVSGSTIRAHSGAAHWADTVLRALSPASFRVVTTLPTEYVDMESGAARTADRLRSHSAIMPHVSCVICHGGSGTVHKALWFGIPVVAIPFALDRYEVAKRVEVAGAGVALPLSQLSTDTLLAAVRQALRCRNGAEAVKRQFRAAGGPRLAADLIEARLSSRREQKGR